MDRVRGRRKGLLFALTFALTLTPHQSEGTPVLMVASDFSFADIIGTRPVLRPFDIAEAMEYLTLANIAYCDPAVVFPKWNCSICTGAWQDFQIAEWLYDPAYDIHGFYGYSPSSNAVVVVYRGTQMYHLKNWIADLDAVSIDYPLAAGARVHRGFFNAYNSSFRDTVFTGMKKLIDAYPSAEIHLTGHSLGGALATLSAADLTHQLGIPIKKLITFGMPRVGNDVFAQWFTDTVISESVRVTHKRDIVPHLPTHVAGISSYHHITREVWQPTDSPSFFVQCDNSGEDPLCADSLRVSLSVSDHLNYLGVPVGTAACVTNTTDPKRRWWPFWGNSVQNDIVFEDVKYDLTDDGQVIRRED
eukprot:comp8077_c0_seq1/m.3566 comp8077_c0_seq1/g.3566  ORF comp8077_c0_seq1/g.3566 comp8077_c0_seq1/m.3566 type:complete len:360 (-) comp8077_c0_seq1:111-1190(-)